MQILKHFYLTSGDILFVFFLVLQTGDTPLPSAAGPTVRLSGYLLHLHPVLTDYPHHLRCRPMGYNFLRFAVVCLTAHYCTAHKPLLKRRSNRLSLMDRRRWTGIGMRVPCSTELYAQTPRRRIPCIPRIRVIKASSSSSSSSSSSFIVLFARKSYIYVRFAGYTLFRCVYTLLPALHPNPMSRSR